MNFLNSIARDLRGRPQEPTAHVAAQQTNQGPQIMIYNLVSRSPLAAVTNRGAAEIAARIYCDAAVQRAASTCHAARAHAIQQGGSLCEIHAAIEQAIEKDEDLDIANVSPDDVAEILRQRADAFEEAAVDARMDAAAHRVAARACDAQHAPLKQAIGKRLTALVIERDGAVTAIESRGRAAAMGLGFNGRHAELKRLGLNDSQILAIDPSAFDPEAKNIADRLRVVELSTLINRLRHADVTRDSDLTSIVGIEAELDAAIAFHRVEGTTA